MIYILNILTPIKKWQTLLLENYYIWIGFTKEHKDLPKNKDLLLLLTNLIKRNMVVAILKILWIVIFKKNGYMIKNNYSTTKSYRKPKHYWHKISYYRKSKNFLQMIQYYKACWKGFPRSSPPLPPHPPPTPHPPKKAEKKTILNAKITKQFQAHKGYPSNYNVEILNSFNAKLQFKDIDSKITIKLKHLVTQLKGFKFMTTLLLEFKKIESDDETKYSTF